VIAVPPIVTVSLTRTGRVACCPEWCAARRYGRDRSLAGNPPLPWDRKVFACIDSDIAMTAPTWKLRFRSLVSRGLGKEKAPAIAEARGLSARLKLERYRTRDRSPHRL